MVFWKVGTLTKKQIKTFFVQINEDNCLIGFYF